MCDERYQHQPWRVRLYRRLRHQPIAYVEAAWWTLKWLARGAPTDGICSRRKFLSMYWGLTQGTWQVRAKWYYTLEEVFSESREAALWEEGEETTSD